MRMFLTMLCACLFSVNFQARAEQPENCVFGSQVAGGLEEFRQQLIGDQLALESEDEVLTTRVRFDNFTGIILSTFVPGSVDLMDDTVWEQFKPAYIDELMHLNGLTPEGAEQFVSWEDELVPLFEEQGCLQVPSEQKTVELMQAAGYVQPPVAAEDVQTASVVTSFQLFAPSEPEGICFDGSEASEQRLGQFIVSTYYDTVNREWQTWIDVRALFFDEFGHRGEVSDSYFDMFARLNRFDTSSGQDRRPRNGRLLRRNWIEGAAAMNGGCLKIPT